MGTKYTNKPEKLTFQEVKSTLNKFAQTLENSDMNSKNYWIGKVPPESDFFNMNRETPLFKPYAQKLVVPPGTEIAFHGDLHGDIHSLIAYLQDLKTKGYLDHNFKIIKPNFYIIFLGDYVDRGNYGIEVMYTLMRLKIANPNHAFMVRGNHEEAGMNEGYGFSQELQTKFPQENITSIYNLYDLLPVVFYLGSGISQEINFIQCCHGGMELGYLPTKLFDLNQDIGFEWIRELNRNTNYLRVGLSNNYFRMDKEDFLTNLIQSQQYFEYKNFMQFKDFKPERPGDLGFLWSDFLVNPPEPFSFLNELPNEIFNPGRGWVYGPILTQAILKESSTNKNKLIGVFRAHQHSGMRTPMMNCILEEPNKGVCKLWDSKDTPLWNDIVITFNVSPDTSYGASLNFNFDTYGLLTTGRKFPDDWRFKVKRINIFCSSIFKHLSDFIRKEVKNIQEIIYMVNDALPTTARIIVERGIELDFVMVGGLSPAEIKEKLTTIWQQLKKCPLSQEDLEFKTIDQNLALINETKESLGNVMLLVSNATDEEFYQAIKQSLNHLPAKGVPIDQAYEALGFSKENRYTISVEDILKKSNEFEKQFSAQTEKGSQIRQVKFTLGNEVGKKIYDAFLGGKEHLAMLLISTAQAEQAGLDFMSLNEKLNTLKSGLEEIKKELIK